MMYEFEHVIIRTYRFPPLLKFKYCDNLVKKYTIYLKLYSYQFCGRFYANNIYMSNFFNLKLLWEKAYKMSISEHNDITELKTSASARGNRVAILRRMTRLSRRLVQQKYSIPKTTLQGWEEGKGNGLTEKGAKKLISALKADGIYCSYDWLMFGIGQAPHAVGRFNVENFSSDEDEESAPEKQKELIAEELQLFYEHHETAIDFIVADDGMEPRFIQGEHVAGCRKHREAIAHCVGLDCIVQTAAGDLLLRRIKRADGNDCYTLSCINLNTTLEKPVLYEVELIMAAPVIWARRCT